MSDDARTLLSAGEPPEGGEPPAAGDPPANAGSAPADAPREEPHAAAGFAPSGATIEAVGADPALAAALVGPPTIRVRHLWHRFGAMDVLKDVSFDVGAGEIFGFIGPNGAGKTTTIRVMATLLEPMAGRVEIDGVDVTIDPDAVRRSIGYMPDHAGVYERITVREYLEFFADAFRVPSLDVVDAVLELTDLGKIQDRIVATMSKGMKQRLQLGRILLHDPKVLILDEPASDLDPRARIEIRDLLLELRGLGKTIFLSSHILTELSDVCTSIGILEKGRLIVAGPIGEIAARLDAMRGAQAVGHAPPPPQAYSPQQHSYSQRAQRYAQAQGARLPYGQPQGYGPQGHYAPPQGYGPHPGAYGPPQQPFGQPSYGAPPHAFWPPGQPHGGPQPPYGGPQQPYGGPQPPYGGPQQPYGGPQQPYGGPQQPYGGPQQPYSPMPAGPPPPHAQAPHAQPPPYAPTQVTPGQAQQPYVSRRKVKVRVLGNPEMAAYHVRGGPGILDVEVIGGVVHVGYTGSEVKIAEIVQHLVRNGVGVVGVEPERNELERIFLEVTRGEMQ